MTKIKRRWLEEQAFAVVKGEDVRGLYGDTWVLDRSGPNVCAAGSGTAGEVSTDWARDLPRLRDRLHACRQGRSYGEEEGIKTPTGELVKVKT